MSGGRKRRTGRQSAPGRGSVAGCMGLICAGACLVLGFGCSTSDGGNPELRTPEDTQDTRSDAAGPARCGEGLFASTDPDTRCQPWRTCQPGQYVAEAGTDTTDRVCAGCPSGTFSDDDDVERCQAWQDCPPGEYVAEAGDETTDRICAVCASGTFSASANTSACQPKTACPAGTVQATGSSSGDQERDCEPCQPGVHCPGGEAAPRRCGPGSWDHDHDPATACVAQTDCVAGQAVAQPGDAVTDRSCATCEAGRFSASRNSPTCQPWSDCPAGTSVESPGSSTKDRACMACDATDYTDRANQEACLPRTTCAPGSVQTDPGSITTPGVCTPCQAGAHCPGDALPAMACPPGTFDDDLDPASPCIDKQACAPGSYVDDEGDALGDRSCTVCGAGSYSDAANASACTPFGTCESGTHIGADGTPTTDRVCATCEPGTFSTAPNQPACTAWTPCPTGFVEATPGSSQSDRTCEREYPIRVSVTDAGDEGGANSFTPAISEDGRIVAFYSQASNLVPGDSNGFEDIFVHDTELGTTDRVSLASDGTQANGRSAGRPALSADGRYVAFASLATNLVPGDTNARKDIFVHDRDTGVTTRVSIASDGAQADADSLMPSISGDGRHVAFHTAATNLVAGDGNTDWDVFVHDRLMGTTERVSLADNGSEADERSFAASLSGDGTRVAFYSFATNLVAGDSNGVADVFVRDRTAGTTVRISVESNGAQANGNSVEPSLSADGMHVAFYSSASDLVAGDGNGTTDVFVHHLATGVTERASLSSAGAEANSEALFPSLSSDGTRVVFRSHASNLVADDTNGMGDIFLRDLTAGTTVRVSQRHDGTQGDMTSEHPALSADGAWVAFYSGASNLVTTDTNNVLDVFVTRAR